MKIDEKLAKAFDADIADLEGGLDTESKTKLNTIKADLKTKILALNNDLK